MGRLGRTSWWALLWVLTACGGTEERECAEGEVLDGVYCIDAPLTENQCAFPNDWADGACYFRQDWSDEDLSGMDLSGARAGGLIMQRTNLGAANLSGADLRNTDLTSALLTDANLDGATLTRAALAGAELGGASWNGATCPDESLALDRGAGVTCLGTFDGALLAGDYQDWNFASANLVEAVATGANLSGVDMTGADLRRADVSGANLDSSVLAGAALDGLVFGEGTTCPDGTTSVVRHSGGSPTCIGTFAGARLGGWDLAGWDLAGANLLDAELTDSDLGPDDSELPTNLAGADLDRANLLSSRLVSADLSGASLQNAILASASLREANLFGADLTGAELQNTVLANARLVEATLVGVTWSPLSNLRGADLSDAIVVDASATPSAVWDGLLLPEAILDRVDFTGASIKGAVMSRAQLFGADFTEADLSDALLDQAAVDLTVVWNNTICPDGTNSNANTDHWGAQVPFSSTGQTCLPGFPFAASTGWDLSGAQLGGQDFSGVTLNGADFTGADATGSTFDDADLSGSTFSGATLLNASLVGADLSNTTFADDGTAGAADLSGADLSGADLSGANLSGATLDNNDWCGWDGNSPGTGDYWGVADSSTICPSGEQAVARLSDLGGSPLIYSCLGDFGVTNADLRGCDLQGWDFTLANLAGMDWRFANLFEAKLIDATWCALDGGLTTAPPTANKDTSCPSGAGAYRRKGGTEYGTCVGDDSLNTHGADLSACDLTNMRLAGGDLSGAKLQGADLTGVFWCQMGNAYVAGVQGDYPIMDDETTCANGEMAMSHGSDHSCVGVHEVGTATHLRYCDFSDWVRPGVNLSQANLEDVILDRANLFGADFTGASLRRANMGDTIAVEATFSGADLTSATLTGTGIAGANFTNATLTSASFDGAIGFAKLQSLYLDPTTVTGFPDVDPASPSLIPNTSPTGMYAYSDPSMADFTGATCPDGSSPGSKTLGLLPTCAAGLLDGDTLDLSYSQPGNNTNMRNLTHSGTITAEYALLRGDWTGANFTYCAEQSTCTDDIAFNMHGARLTGTFRNANFGEDPNTNKVRDLSYATLTGSFQGASFMRRTNLSNAYLAGDFVDPTLDKTTANPANMFRAQLEGARIEYETPMCFVNFNLATLNEDTCIAGDMQESDGWQTAYEESFTLSWTDERVVGRPAWGYDIRCPSGDRSNGDRPGCANASGWMYDTNSGSLGFGCGQRPSGATAAQQAANAPACEYVQ